MTNCGYKAKMMKGKEKQIAFTLADYQRRRREMFHIWFNSLAGNHKVSTFFFLVLTSQPLLRWQTILPIILARMWRVFKKRCCCSYGEQTATDMSRWIMTVQPPLHSFVILQWYGGEGVKRVPMTFDPISLYYPVFSFAKKKTMWFWCRHISSLTLSGKEKGKYYYRQNGK